MGYPSIVILTGAGISAESGIRTFRDSNGLWEDHRIEDVASPEGFIRNPDLVYRFYNMRRRQLLSKEVRPNAAHMALAKLAALYPGHVALITQNIDDLHERAGSPDVIHMHGELLKARCQKCHGITSAQEDFDHRTVCGSCQSAGGLRPHIVWFGEMPLYMEDISRMMEKCDIFAAIGTSGQVYPAAGFVDLARSTGARTIELNLDISAGTSRFDRIITGAAGDTVPAWVDEILAGL